MGSAYGPSVCEECVETESRIHFLLIKGTVESEMQRSEEARPVKGAAGTSSSLEGAACVAERKLFGNTRCKVLY